jgi:hypothetical protein
VRWLEERFRDHDRLVLAAIRDAGSNGSVRALLVRYARRTSDTLRRLGFPNGIVPQVAQKLPFVFVHGRAKLLYFGLASPSAPTPNPECRLVAASVRS